MMTDMSSQFKQRGVSLSGLLFACVLIGGIALIGMKLFPLYNEKLKVDAALKNTAAQSNIARQSNQEIMSIILRNFEISDVDRFETIQTLGKVLDIENLPNNRGKSLRIAYEIRGPFFGALDVVLKYDTTVELEARFED